MNNNIDKLTESVNSIKFRVVREADLLQTVPSVFDTKLAEAIQTQTNTVETMLEIRRTELATEITAHMQSAQQPATVSAAAPATFADLNAESFLAAAQPATRKPRQSPFMSSLSNAALDSNIKQASFALRVGKGALYALERFGVEALLVNSDHMTEEECNDDSIIEAVHRATENEGEPSRQTIIRLNTPTPAHSEHAAASMPTPSVPENSADLALTRSGRPTFKST